MNDAFYTILGELLVTAGIFAIPILCALSFSLNWDVRISASLAFFSVIDYLALWTFISENIDYGG